MTRAFQPGPAYFRAVRELRRNPGQLQAFDATGNCLVLAGPGSGKTRTLTVKLARMLAEDVVPPQGIACITFSAECAREIRKRMALLGVEEGPEFFIGTVHSFCLKRIILPFADLGGISIVRPVTVASKAEQSQAWADATRVVGGVAGPGLDAYLQSYRRTRLDRNAPAWTEDRRAAALLEAYEQALHARGRIDFDDMILIGRRLVGSHEWIRSALAARYPILAIDEYQDLGVALHQEVVGPFETG